MIRYWAGSRWRRTGRVDDRDGDDVCGLVRGMELGEKPWVGNV